MARGSDVPLPNFSAQNDIDVSVLRHLTDQDLKELGISLGRRRKLLAAVADMQSAQRTQTCRAFRASPQSAPLRCPAASSRLSL
jgi:hypothetical protein